MYLIMMKEKPTSMIQLKICELLNVPSAKESYDGESTKTIQDHLTKESKDCAVISADSRFLTLVDEYFSIENVFIFKDEKLTKLSELTKRQLKEGHNLMKLYESGEFGW